MSDPWATWVGEACRVIEAAGQWRRPRTFDARGPVGLLQAPDGTGGEVVSFASNDYLGLSTTPWWWPPPMPPSTGGGPARGRPAW